MDNFRRNLIQMTCNIKSTSVDFYIILYYIIIGTVKLNLNFRYFAFSLTKTLMDFIPYVIMPLQLLESLKR